MKIIAIFLATVFLSFAHAGEIKQVKGKNVLIQDIDAAPGDEIFAIDSGGKKRAIIEITQVKDRSAIGNVIKGKARVGHKTRPKRSAPRAESESEEDFTTRKSRKTAKLFVGGVFGYAMDTINVSLSNENINNTGSGFSVKAIADYNFSKNFAARLLTGYETLNASGTATTNRCLPDRKCVTKVSYLTLDAWAKYSFLTGTLGMWVGAGVGFAIPMGTKETNILATSSITQATLLYLGGGLDLKLGQSWYIPVHGEYAMFMPQTEVKTSWIALRLGIMFKF